MWQLVAGPRISHTGSNAFALALTSTGDVYSWGKGYRGRLGHNHTGDCRIPKLVEALAGKDIRMVSIAVSIMLKFRDIRGRRDAEGERMGG